MSCVNVVACWLLNKKIIKKKQQQKICVYVRSFENGCRAPGQTAMRCRTLGKACGCARNALAIIVLRLFIDKSISKHYHYSHIISIYFRICYKLVEILNFKNKNFKSLIQPHLIIIK